MSDKNVLEAFTTWEFINIYTKSVLIGFWVILKWILNYFWLKLDLNFKQTNFTNRERYPVKPPKCLVDSNFGIHCYIKVDSTKFHYVEAGNKNDPLVVLLHGYPDCWIGWRYQISHLSKFFHVIVLDLKGYNDSDKPQWRNAYTPQKICYELREIIKSFDINSATIIGHDIGGIIGWVFAHLYPETVNRFISVSTSHPNLFWDSLPQESNLNSSLLKLIQLPFIAEIEVSNMSHLEKFYSYLLPVKEKNYFYSVTKRSNKLNEKFSDNEEILNAYRYIFNRKMDWTGALNYFRNFPFYRIKKNKSLRCPCLIIAGNLDPTCCLGNIIKSTSYCENFMLKIIDGAKHNPHQEMPEQFNKVLLTFLVGNRAEESMMVDKISASSKGLLSRMLGAVTSNSAKISGLVLDTVNQNSKEIFVNS